MGFGRFRLGNINTFFPILPEIFQSHLPDNLSASSIKRDSLDHVQFGVYPIHIMGVHIDGQVPRVADARSNKRLPSSSIEERFSNARVLTIIDPEKQTLNGIDGKFSRCIYGGFHQNFTMFPIQSTHFQVVFMWENVGKVQVPGYPINGQAADSVAANTVFDNVLKLWK